MKTTTEVDLGENRSAYIKKMTRQIKEAQKKVHELTKISNDRAAYENPEVKRELEHVAAKLDETERKFENLKADAREPWPEGSRDVSEAYKELEDLIDDAGKKLKRK